MTDELFGRPLQVPPHFGLVGDVFKWDELMT